MKHKKTALSSFGTRATRVGYRADQQLPSLFGPERGIAAEGILRCWPAKIVPRIRRVIFYLLLFSGLRLETNSFPFCFRVSPRRISGRPNFFTSAMPSSVFPLGLLHDSYRLPFYTRHNGKKIVSGVGVFALNCVLLKT